jgi:hypothetical protein
MEHTGMVHALESIHRLLKPEGSLIDIHPFAEPPLIEIHQGGKIAVVEQLPAYAVEDIRQAETALTHVIQHKIFAIERAHEFDFRIYASSVAELHDFLTEADAFANSPPDEAATAKEAELAARVEGLMRVAGEGSEVAHYEKVRITRLRQGN